MRLVLSHRNHLFTVYYLEHGHGSKHSPIRIDGGPTQKISKKGTRLKKKYAVLDLKQIFQER